MNKQLLIILASLFFAGVASAASIVFTPTTLEGGAIVTAEQAHALFKSGEATFVDTRSALNYGRGHVPDALFISYQSNSEKVVQFNPGLDQFDLTKLPSGKESVLVFYSHGDTGWKSYKAAVVSIAAGYSRVHWMREGMAVWMNDNYPVEH